MCFYRKKALALRAPLFKAGNSAQS